MAGRQDTTRLNIRLPEVIAESARFWADKDSRDLGSKVSMAEFVSVAVENEVARRNGLQVGSENLLVSRINQLAEMQAALTSSIDSLARVVTTSNAMMTSLARGETRQLTDAETEDGELEFADE